MRNLVLNIENKIFEYFFERVLSKTILQNPNYRYFRNEVGIDKWAQNHSHYFQKLMSKRSSCQATKEELLDLKTLDFYAGFVSKPINNLLRGKPIYRDEKYIKNHISILNAIVNKFSIQENIIAIRRMPKKYIEMRPKMNNFIEKGFLSTSLNLSYRLNDSSDNSLLESEALLLLKIPRGINAAYLEKAQLPEKRRHEYELLIQRNSIILIERKIKILGNVIIVAKIQNE